MLKPQTHIGARQMAKNTALVGAIQILGVGLLFLMQVMVSRLLDSPHQYGTFAWGMSLVQFLASIAALGVPMAAMRLVSAATATGQWGRERTIVRICYAVVGSAGTALAVVALAGWSVVQESVPNGEAMMVAMLIVPFLVINAMTRGLARAYGFLVIAFSPERVWRPVLTMLAVFVLWRLNGEISARDALVSVLFAVAVSVGVQTGLFLYKRSAALMSGAGQPAGPVGRELAGVAFPMFIAGILGTLMTHADVLMLGILAGQEETAALYAASRLSMLVALPLVIVNGGLATIFARHFARDDPVSLQKAVTFGAHASLWPTLVLSVFAVVFAEDLLRLFGDFYEDQKTLLYMLILGQLINVAAGSVAVLLTVTKHEKKNARVLAITVAVNIGMNLLLIPYFGALGAAAATATSLVVRNLWLYGVVRRELGIYPSVFKPLQPV